MSGDFHSDILIFYSPSPQTANQRKCLRSEKENRQNERTTNFCKKTRRKRLTLAAMWRSRRDSNSRVVLAATRFPVVLVMTTSILLHLYADRGQRHPGHLDSKMYYTSFFSRVKYFFEFFWSFLSAAPPPLRRGRRRSKHTGDHMGQNQPSCTGQDIGAEGIQPGMAGRALLPKPGQPAAV